MDLYISTACGAVRVCLVSVSKQQVSVFKQHFTYFNTLFHPHVFPQKFLNNNFQFLNTCTKRVLNTEQKDINVSAVAINIITTQVIEAIIYLFIIIFFFLRNGNPYFREQCLTLFFFPYFLFNKCFIKFSLVKRFTKFYKNFKLNKKIFEKTGDFEK